ncbi:cytochrome b/b6 domain-containing protein [Arthrobacter sp. AQ5-05]|uniref:cytochrome b/b6 domain-containing protein n=1 Tax=Arthrobacter sp. AQ5-05 TaxID=2184581 RepID=UPI002570D804|nr:cytochrome b/b6 domain-containing protein [Arthrobacter sp. AQ5-05]
MLTAGAGVALLVLLVLAAKWLRGFEGVQDFLAEYTGHSALPEGAPVGLPGWLRWQHFLNGFFLLLMVRTGWLVHTTTRPAAYWTRKNKGLLRTKGAPKKISLDLWLHLTLDMLWVLNGMVFAVFLLATGQWMRIVPTSWDIFPNALSALLQYASLEWPLEQGWVNYNAMQVLAYFLTVFIAAPLALASGLRMSPAWPKNAPLLNRVFPIGASRAIHLPVMFYFVGFVVVHVALVLATGAVANLNHMYAGGTDGSWAGVAVFALSLVLMVAGWFMARPLFIRPIASLTGNLSR